MENSSADPAAPSVGPPVVRIPLYRRGGAVRAHALVDAEDAPLVGRHRWYVNSNGYAVRQEVVEGRRPSGKPMQRTVLMARVILGLAHGDQRESDHISRDKLDNRRCNLRVATHAQNAQNRVRTDGVSKYRGVSRRRDIKKKPWVAYATRDGKQCFLGHFATEEEAAAVASAFRAEHQPFSEDATIA